MPGGLPSKQEVENQLARILGSSAFGGAERPARLLRFLVEETLDGRAAQLKESVLAVAVLGRSPGFDPKIDPIARVEASRLRTRIELYYGSEGTNDDVRILLPKGTYSPVFELRERHGDPLPPTSGAALLVRVLGAILLAALLVAAGFWIRPGPLAGDSARIKLAMAAPDGTTLHSIAMSPDGETVAIAAYKEGISKLYIRRLDSFTATALPGSESAGYPFWSPDSRAIGFFAKGKLQIADLSGGPPRSLCDAPLGRGGTWSASGEILFAPSVASVLYRVSSTGGAPVPVTKLNASRSDTAHMWPHFLPDGRRFLYLAIASNPAMSGIDVSSTSTDTASRLVPAGSLGGPAGRNPGYILFERNGALSAQQFDSGRATVNGEPLIIAQQLRFDPLTRYAFLSTSNNGTVAFVSGSPFDQEVAWLDAKGAAPVRAGGSGDIISLRLSPSAQYALVNRNDEQSGRPGAWILDLARGSAHPLSRQYVDWFPIWSPYENEAVFSRVRTKAPIMDLMRVPTAGGEPVLLHSFDHAVFPSDWSPDGASIAYTAYDGNMRTQVWILPVATKGAGQPYPFSAPGHNSGGAVFYPSPVGRTSPWIAYTSDESGRNEIYVQSFPKPVRKIQVSPAGGDRPLWRADGKALFFVDPKGRLTDVRVVDPRTMQTGTPTSLRTLPAPNPAVPYFALNYAPAADGSRFLVRQRIGAVEPESISVMTNWRP
jgi:Tol biopolymer transport system component